MEPTEKMQTRPDGTTYTPNFTDGLEFLQQWQRENLDEYDQLVEWQQQLNAPVEEQKQSQEVAVAANAAESQAEKVVTDQRHTS